MSGPEAQRLRRTLPLSWFALPSSKMAWTTDLKMRVSLLSKPPMRQGCRFLRMMMDSIGDGRMGFPLSRRLASNHFEHRAIYSFVSHADAFIIRTHRNRGELWFFGPKPYRMFLNGMES